MSDGIFQAPQTQMQQELAFTGRNRSLEELLERFRGGIGTLQPRDFVELITQVDQALDEVAAGEYTVAGIFKDAGADPVIDTVTETFSQINVGDRAVSSPTARVEPENFAVRILRAGTFVLTSNANIEYSPTKYLDFFVHVNGVVTPIGITIERPSKNRPFNIVGTGVIDLDVGDLIDVKWRRETGGGDFDVTFRQSAFLVQKIALPPSEQIVLGQP